jgi:PAS domain S-box-containing protein
VADGHHVGFRIDITELKLATAAAELTSAQRGEEQRRMQSILEGTQVGAWEWNVQTGENIYNEQYVQMLGYTLQELQPLMRDDWSRLVHPDDLASSRQKLQEHLLGARASYDAELRMRHKDGHWVWVLSKGKLTSRSEDGKPLWVYGTHMDITERKLAERQLAHTMAMLQNVLDSATAVGVVALGQDQLISVFNRGAENLLGFAAAEVIDLQSASIFFDASELSALRETLELIWGREPDAVEVFAHVLDIREEQEWTLVRKDGSRFKASLIFSQMRDAQGVQVGHLAMVYDISKQKEYESSLRKATLLAEQSSTAKSQFLANMSHEIRTPMNAILGMLQLLRNTELSVRQKDYAEKAAGAARSLLVLLNDILDFSKVEAGKMQLNPEPFVLEELLSDLSVILSANLGAKEVDLLFDIDPAIPNELIGDTMRLKQVLINLGGNAVKFTEQGQVVIRWKLLSQELGSVRIGIEVVDTGIGIAPENQSRIFDAFTQAESDTTRRFGGTGLGLVISTRLIRLMGGELKLQSAVNKGSTFSFVVQLATVEPAPFALAQSAPATLPDAKHVLLVDDNPTALAISAAMMRSLGWVVEQASSGAEAIGMLGAHAQQGGVTMDAMFVDSQMPDMDGWETLRYARRLCAGQPVPRMVLMVRHSRESFDEGSDRESQLADGVLVKPLTAAMFAEALARARHLPVASLDATVVHVNRLAGMRVLLVEDNAINQQVAQELLRSEGAHVEVADNGALGVAAVRQAKPGFDIVLMDLQMPVMDGLAATRVLRADARFAKLPIVAMTANAMDSDREECIAVGMNDHVGKPFDLNQLVQTLVAQTLWTPIMHAVAVEPAPVQKHASGDAWPSEMDVDKALVRMGGNADLLRRSLTAFAADARILPQRLEQWTAQADWKALKRELHSLKGLSATVGLDDLSALAAAAEKQVYPTSLAPGFAQACDALLKRLSQTLGALDAAIALWHTAAVVPAPVASPAWDQATRTQLRELLLALRASDMASMELHAQLRQQLNEAHADSLAALDEAMAELDFDTAATACETLLQQIAPHVSDTAST